ncbi:MAG TPA: ATP-binding protein, partial [Candidatus Saccharimonadales bacterium]
AALISLLWLQYKLAVKSTVGYSLVLAAMILGYGVIYFMLQMSLNVFAFVGVLPAGLLAYAFGHKGRILGHLFVLNIIAWNFVYATAGQDIGWTDFSQLVGYLSLVALMIEFVSENVELSKQELQDISQSNHRIRVEHQRLLSLINNIGDAVIGTDYEGTIQTYNGAALELLDTNVSITGRRLGDVCDLIDSEGNQVDLVAEARKVQRTVRRNDIRLRYEPEDIANLYINVTPIKVGYGQQSEKGFTLILRDITKEKSLEEERDEFVSVVSHELRTPVTITEGKVSNALLLIDKDEADREKLKKSLSQAHEQVVYLANMINDLSSLARAERSESQMDLESIEPKKLADALAASYSIQAQEKGLAFDLHYADNLPTLYTSRLYLQEVLQNFLTNSIKYTKQGKITLAVEPAGPGKVLFSVIDTGIGISKSDKKHLFEKFFRSEDYRTRESSGTGLGLYVTRKLIHKLQGKVEIDSTINQGSTFKVTVGSLEKKPRRGQTVS